jgi:inosine-uridine nucleoside N-ribohydrolase
MQFQPQGKPSPGIVFDADLGNTIDDALALAMLFGFQGKNESRVISVSTTKSSLDAAIFADVLVRFYTGEPGAFAPAIPIGLSLSGKMSEANPMLAAVTGNAKYARTIAKMNDTADPLALIRNALSAQFDQNAVVLLTGPATNLAGLLALPGSAPLIA